ncbi:A/G-specific adenine glycosylase [Rubidibacter lacunae KORDI 51-2]|uniref:Adenine DNA glycosylase n=1 Tax=Rubidibacter lacunae KORDI 51-2 TaxID=582515 RepID=U5DM88_9CHRO|nr:A/G-specific adenine glycosylase [Rubidibacter lacunae]ERN41992.1 A/G-specific adenine glycosylase [Rubidibacter lacunae KORDI 51-2]
MEDVPPSDRLDAKDIEQLRRSLLGWYAQHGRDLPWRRTRDPYAIWVSEIMLQQTQVTTVLPYYQRWLERFPTVFALARADLQSVLKVWEGLGYYARARNLHRAAQMVVDDCDGRVPREVNVVMQLPGIGRTTAGGLLSAAFNLPVPILDGNVKRVLTRLSGSTLPPTAAQRLLWQLSEQLLDRNQPRDFNQALMDLGATLCVPRQPSCPLCPWRECCVAYHLGLQEQIPVSARSPDLPHKHIGVAAIWNDRGQILIDRRPARGLLGGLWEFPGGKIEPGETVEDCIAREITEELAIAIEVGDRLVEVTHAYSHFRVTLYVHHCRYLEGEPQPLACEEIRWVKPSELVEFPFPRANLRIIEALPPTSPYL